jgi:hypothetical protein
VPIDDEMVQWHLYLSALIGPFSSIASPPEILYIADSEHTNIQTKSDLLNKDYAHSDHSD